MIIPHLDRISHRDLRTKRARVHKIYGGFYFISIQRILLYFVGVIYYFRQTFFFIRPRTLVYIIYIYMYNTPKEFPNKRPFNRVWLVAGSAGRSLPWDRDPFVEEKKNFASLTCLFLAPFAPSDAVHIHTRTHIHIIYMCVCVYLYHIRYTQTVHRSCQSGWFPYRKTVFVLTSVKKRPKTSHVYSEAHQFPLVTIDYFFFLFFFTFPFGN